MAGITDPVSLSPGAALGSAAISGGAGLIGSGLQYLFNKKLAAQQNEYNLNMWKLQSEYNSPQAQMERFRSAGLNPNLIYGQGSNGNMSNAPEMVTPNAPQIDKQMQRIGELFNIENLRTLTANRKKAQADAQNAETNSNRNLLEFAGDILFGQKYGFNPKSGKYEIRPQYDADGNRIAYSKYGYYFDDRLRKSMRETLLKSNIDYLAPQIIMSNYEGENKKFSYWLGKAEQIIRTIGSSIGLLNPRNFHPFNGVRGHYIAPGGRIYNY